MNKGRGNRIYLKARSLRKAKGKNATKTAMKGNAKEKKTETCVVSKIDKTLEASSSGLVKNEKYICEKESKTKDNLTASIIKIEKNVDMLCEETCRLHMCLKAGGFGKPFILLKRELYFGSDNACDVSFEDMKGLGPKHCCITIDNDGQAFVEPLDKTGVTLLNGEVLQSKKSLRNDDIITIVNKSFRFNYHCESEFSKLKIPSISKQEQEEPAGKKHVQKGKSGKRKNSSVKSVKWQNEQVKMPQMEKNSGSVMKFPEDEWIDSLDDLYGSEDDSEDSDVEFNFEFPDDDLKKLFGLNYYDPLCTTESEDESLENLGQEGDEIFSVKEEYPLLNTVKKEEEDVKPPIDKSTGAETGGDDSFKSLEYSERQTLRYELRCLASLYRNKRAMTKLHNFLNTLASTYDEICQRERNIRRKALEFKNAKETSEEGREHIQEVLDSFMYAKEKLQCGSEDPKSSILSIKAAIKRISMQIQEIEKRSNLLSLDSDE